MTNQPSKGWERSAGYTMGPLLAGTHEHNKNQRTQVEPLTLILTNLNNWVKEPRPAWTRCGLPCGLPCFLISLKPSGSLKTFQNWSLPCSSPWLVMRFRFARPHKREVHSTESGLHRIFRSRAGGLAPPFRVCCRIVCCGSSAEIRLSKVKLTPCLIYLYT
jgi:hypothetical protein